MQFNCVGISPGCDGKDQLLAAGKLMSWKDVMRRSSYHGVEIPDLHFPAQRVHPVTGEVVEEHMLVRAQADESATCAAEDTPPEAYSPTVAYMLQRGGFVGEAHFIGAEPGATFVMTSMM